ncbi:MAG: VOC family protein [Pseudomonadota bacterium]
MITGINHITLAVADLARSVAFYRDVLRFKLASQHHGGAYFRAGGCWLCLSLDARAAEQSRSDYTHLAFDIAASDFDDFAATLVSAGVPIWKENSSEGASVYFADPDGHKLELHVGTLDSRLQALAARSCSSARGPECSA